MADESKVISALPTLTQANGSTSFLVNHVASGVANTYQMPLTKIMTYQTPANSSISCVRGQLFYDANYLYVAVANNTLKRVALESF